MLGRLIYVAIIMAVILAGGFAFDFLANEPGQITVDYGDRLYEVSLFEAALLLVIGIVLLMVVVWALKILIAIVRFILGDENAFGGFFVRSRERRGIDALGKGMTALAAGDAKTARRKAELAERKLQSPALTRLLNAQAADLAGERTRAATYYKALMSDPETAFVGTSGLLQHALADQDTNRALKLATHARDLRPKDAATLDTLYTLQSQKFDWAAARKTLSAQIRAGHVPKLEGSRREAALIMAQAEDAERLGESEHARALAIEAAKLDPSNVRAVTMAVGHLIGSGSRRAASKLITDGWRAAPHPQLAASFAEIDPDEAPAQRRRRFEGLFTLHPDHAETNFLKAELSLAAEDWTGARKAIETLRETEPSARSCAIMAAIARGEGEPDYIVRGWLARALSAPRDGASEAQISHAAMLPLLIGPSAEEAADEAADVTGAQEKRAGETVAATAVDDIADAETLDPETPGAKSSESPLSEGETLAPEVESPNRAKADAGADRPGGDYVNDSGRKSQTETVG